MQLSVTMKKSIKAALLSGLVFPGLGQLYLKRYGSALLMISASVALIYFTLSYLFRNAMEVVGEIDRGELAGDLASITQRVSEQTQSSSGLVSLGLAALLVLWVFSIVHAHKSGKMI